MKTLQKAVKMVYRFRCEKCQSKFEMTREEKVENDWRYTSKIGGSGDYPNNPMNYFPCPVCKCKRRVGNGDMEIYVIMEDGTEVLRNRY